MPKIFKRLITFEIEGEIFDKETKPEDIIKNYHWDYRSDCDGKMYIAINHDDNRGRITKILKLPGIKKSKKPDTEYFII